MPRFSVFERVPIAHNVILKLPAPVEIAASKVAFADRIDRTKDLQDIKFIQEKFGSRREEILQKLFTIERETHRRSAIMVWRASGLKILDKIRRAKEALAATDVIIT